MKYKNAVYGTMKIRPEKCWNCGEEISELNTIEYDTELFAEIDGKEIRQGETRTIEGRCPKCGYYVPSREIDKLDNKLADEWGKANDPNYLSMAVIASLPRKYNVSRGDFEKILHIENIHKIDGRYEPFNLWEGDAINDEERQSLEAVKNDPGYFIELLEAAKDELSSEAFERAMARADLLLKHNDK